MSSNYAPVQLSNPQDPSLQPFFEACKQGDISQVKALAAGRDRNDGSLTYGLKHAAEADHPNVMRILLEHGAVIDAFVIFNTKSLEGFQALMDHGWGINDPLGFGEVALPSVIAWNDESLVRWFLSHGADPNFGQQRSRDTLGEGPVSNSGAALETAAANCGPAMVDLLLAHGAKLDNSLALHTAVIGAERTSSERIAMMDHLIKLGADINKLGDIAFLIGGGTPLHVAASLGRLEETGWLLEHGADITKKNMFGYPAPLEAVRNNHQAVAEFMRSYWESAQHRQSTT